MRLAALVLLLATAALADDDPPGTVPIQLHVGKSAPIKTVHGSNVLCDDLEVVKPELEGEEYVLRAVGPGSTLCGVWFGEQKPGGLYRVTVTAAKAKPRPHPDGGSSADIRRTRALPRPARLG